MSLGLERVLGPVESAGPIVAWTYSGPRGVVVRRAVFGQDYPAARWTAERLLGRFGGGADGAIRSLRRQVAELEAPGTSIAIRLDDRHQVTFGHALSPVGEGDLPEDRPLVISFDHLATPVLFLNAERARFWVQSRHAALGRSLRWRHWTAEPGPSECAAGLSRVAATLAGALEAARRDIDYGAHTQLEHELCTTLERDGREVSKVRRRAA